MIFIKYIPYYDQWSEIFLHLHSECMSFSISHSFKWYDSLCTMIHSSISMLEVPVAFMVESKGLQRKKAVLLMASVIFVLSCIIILNFETLFGFVIALTTEYSQPLLGLALCIFAGWVWRRDAILDELKQGDQFAEHSIFWKIWRFLSFL